MNPYAIVSLGTAEAASLRARLMAWHDAMVAHERRLRLGRTTDVCDEDCPHVEADTLWAEVSAVLGSRAAELAFLRSRARNATASSRQTGEPATTAIDSSTRSRIATGAITTSAQA
jgi:hypothetical protein